MENKVSFKDYAIVACGTLVPELTYLKKDGFLDAKKLLFTSPGLHEKPRELEKQLIKQIQIARKSSDKVIVVYGGKYCYIDPDDPYKTIDTIIRSQGPGISRVNATHCVDMLTSREDRDALTNGKGENVWWLTPGWLLYRYQVFLDRDKGFAVENFPLHRYTEGAGLVDTTGFFDKYAEEHAEEILDFSDWIGLPIVPYPVTPDRFKGILMATMES